MFIVGHSLIQSTKKFKLVVSEAAIKFYPSKPIYSEAILLISESGTADENVEV